MSSAWYLVHAKTGQERLAEFNLRRQGYRTFLPGVRRTVRHARQTRVEKAALFPGYLFVSLDVERDRWRKVDGTIGVVRLITNLERPVRAPSGLVQMLIEHSDAEGIIDVAWYVGAGGFIRVSRGPLAGKEGLVHQLTAGDRIRVLLSLLGSEVKVELDRSACEAA